MTDTGPPTYPGDIVVTPGQTARGPSPFSNLQWPTKGQTGDGPPVEVIDQGDPGTGPAGQTGPSDEQIACADPEKKKQWNKDAFSRDAQERLRAFAAARGDGDMASREYGALICQFSDGSYDIGAIAEGPPLLDANGRPVLYPTGVPFVPIDPFSCQGSTPVGYIHNHPGTLGLPSDGDFAFLDYLATYAGADRATVNAYVSGQYQNPSTNDYVRRMTRAQYSERPVAQTSQYQPAWVNPEAVPCPGGT